MSGSIIPDKQEHVHKDMFSNGSDVGPCDFQNLYLVLYSGVEIDMI